MNENEYSDFRNRLLRGSYDLVYFKNIDFKEVDPDRMPKNGG